MDKSQRQIWLLIAIACFIPVTILLLPHIITDPSQHMIMLGGDAGKNYSAYLYHILYEKGASSLFMNYPYGDNILYMDGIPALSIPLATLNQLIPLSPQSVLAVMHWAIGLSYIIALVYSYKTLVTFNVAPLFAIIFSSLIIIMSPQLFRITGGHFGLAFNFLIPMLLYWTTQYHFHEKPKYPLYIFFAGTIAGFFHPYFIALLSVWYSCYILSYFILNKNSFKSRIRHAIPIAISLIAVLIVFKAFLFFTDPIKDRPQYPWGTLEYCTAPSSILTSEYSPLWQYIHSHYEDIGLSSSSEGYAYIGLVVMITISVAILSGAFFLFKKKKQESINKERQFPKEFLFIAIIGLILAMGIPFIWHMQWLLNYVSIFRQFRSLGRFNWLFYYIITTFAAIQLYRWHLQLRVRNRKWLSYLTIILPLLLWCIEAGGYVSKQRSELQRSRHFYEVFFLLNEKDPDLFLKEHHIVKDSFQAILLLPYIHSGSDKLWLGGEYAGWDMTFAGSLALRWHLPIMDAILARVSWSQTFCQARTFAGPVADKPVIDKMGSKPFLLFFPEKYALDPDTKYLLAASDYIGSYSDCKFYACYPQRILENDKNFSDSIMPIYNTMHTGDTCFSYPINDTNSILSRSNYYLKHFYDNGLQYSLTNLPGNAAIQDNYSFRITPQCDSQLYEFSVWTLVNNKDYTSPSFAIDVKDSTGTTLFTKDISVTKSVDNYNFWFRASAYFNLPSGCYMVKCRVTDGLSSFYALDEMCMRPASAVTISKFANGAAMINNHLYKK